MKDHNCDWCDTVIEVDDDYEPEFCCMGTMEDMCGCMGKPINPVFCSKCDKQLGGQKQ